MADMMDAHIYVCDPIPVKDPLSKENAEELSRHILGPNHGGPLPFHYTFESFANEVAANVPANYEYVLKHAKRGDVTSVLNVMDAFGYLHHMISIGDVAGVVVDEQVEQVKPKVVLELGTCAGYGTLRFARKMREVVGPSAHVYTFEVWEPFAELAEKLFEYAGMSDMITVIHGSFAEKVDELKKLGVERADIVLIDHNNQLYLSDLKLIESTNLLRKGSVVIGDNVIAHFITDYCDYVSESPLYETRILEMAMSYFPKYRDGMAISTYLGPAK